MFLNDPDKESFKNIARKGKTLVANWYDKNAFQLLEAYNFAIL